MKADHHFELRHAGGVQVADVFVGDHQADVVISGQMLAVATLENARNLFDWYGQIANSIPQGLRGYAHWPNGEIQELSLRGVRRCA